eukprot:7452577-Pyramimonas_sp.AAC.1
MNLELLQYVLTARWWTHSRVRTRGMQKCNLDRQWRTGCVAGRRNGPNVALDALSLPSMVTGCTPVGRTRSALPPHEAQEMTVQGPRGFGRFSNGFSEAPCGVVLVP